MQRCDSSCTRWACRTVDSGCPPHTADWFRAVGSDSSASCGKGVALFAATPCCTCWHVVVARLAATLRAQGGRVALLVATAHPSCCWCRAVCCDSSASYDKGCRAVSCDSSLYFIGRLLSRSNAATLRSCVGRVALQVATAQPSLLLVSRDLLRRFSLFRIHLLESSTSRHAKFDASILASHHF